MKVFITGRIPKLAFKILSDSGFQVSSFNKDIAIAKNELFQKTKFADGIISLLSTRIDKEFIDNLNNCKIIANYAVGYNNIDLKYAKEKGIVVTNTPDVLTDSTSDIAISLIFACARRIAEGDRFVRAGKFKGWKPDLMLGQKLIDKTLGIVGAGRIGQETARKAKAFGLKIIYYSLSKKYNFELETQAKKVSLETLMKKSDIISIHLPLTDKTKNLVNRNYLDLMKPSAIFVNTARGEVVDEDYLISLLKKKKIFSAGFDVYKNEPNINKNLMMLENVVLLPHIGSATVETRNKMAELAAKNVILVLHGKKAITPVV